MSLRIDGVTQPVTCSKAQENLTGLFGAAVVRGQTMEIHELSIR
jgi:hypothetical protein